MSLNLAASDISSEKRRAARFTMLMRTAKLITSAGEYLCLVRDASPFGARVRTFSPLPRDVMMMLELSKGERYGVKKVWERDESAGFQFTEPVRLDKLLGDGREGLRKRPVRLKTILPATLYSQGTPHEVLFRDISQQGASIECFSRLAIDALVRIESEHLPTLVAKVRWRREPHYGLIFEQTFQFVELARLMAPLRLQASTVE